MASLYELSVQRLDGSTDELEQYRGDVLLVVNVASHCGFTPQYEGLEHLYRKYRHEGFTVLGFPCNQFGKQEPGSAPDIESFCRIKYQIGFPMHAKVKVNGDGAHPLFDLLKNEAPGVMGTKNIKWNFTKFLVGRDGRVIERFSSVDTPGAMENAVLRALAEEEPSPAVHG